MKSLIYYYVSIHGVPNILSTIFTQPLIKDWLFNKNKMISFTVFNITRHYLNCFFTHFWYPGKIDYTEYTILIKKQNENKYIQAQLRAEADRLGCLSSTDVWTWDNQPHGDSIQS